MATLTGFKVVGDSSSSGASDQQQQSTNGHQNPVFVFEEVDVGDGTDSLKGNNDEADVFVDANSVNIADATAASADNHPTIKTMSNTASTTTTTNATAPVVPVESMTNGQGTIDQQQRQPSSPTMTNSSSSSGTVVQQTANNSTTPVTQTTNNESDQHQQDLTRKAANQTVSQQQQQQQKSVTPPSKSKQQHSAIAIDMPISAALMPVSAPSTPMGTRKNKGGSSKNNSNNNSHHQHSLSPNANNDPSQADSMSVSMLSIGTGKSPRTPRRSPLMALFRGKPRESVRKMYTDEDQFEIEWANVCLELQEKWYQKYSVSQLTSLLCGGGGSDSSNKNSNASNVDTKSQRNKLILNTVNGRIRSGEITAILGPSGAGKTSLLHSLFGKHRTAIQGSIKVTGAPTKKHLTVCTIPQSDYLIGYLTTQEALWFASRLKNTEDDFNHDKNIERVIELLGLQRCRDTRINKLSGGQYKRVSIAQEMLSSPDILVLDEPTSGLDSLTCYRTVKVLRDLVEASKAHNLVNPMSIVLTIHQPHREVLDLFHSIYIMAVGGQCLYQGTPNEMENTINHYSGVNMPQTGYNPASFMVEIASEEYGREPIQKLVDFAQKRFHSTSKHDYSASRSTTPIMAPNNNNNNRSGKQISNSTDSLAKLSYTNKKGDSQVQLYPLSKTGNNSSSTATLALSTDQYVDIDLSSGNTLQVASATKSEIDSRVKTPRSGKNSDGVFWTHVSLMAKRAFLSNLRDPLLCTIRVGAHIFIPLVVALIYGPKMGIPNGCPFYKPEIDLLEYASMGVDEIEAKHDDIRIQFQNVGLHFMVYYAFGLCMLAFTAISFPLIMHVLIKEIRNGWYSLSTFILGKMLAELPAALILPPISVGIIYVLTGQPSSYLQWRYMVQSLLLVLIIMIAEAKGLIFGAICMNSMQTAVFSASVSTVPFILLSGFLIRIREVPYVLQRLSFLSYFKHSVEALIITRYGFGMCPCNPDLIPPGGTPVITGIPVQIMSLTDYYINQYSSSVDSSKPEGLDNGDDTTLETNIVGNNRNVSKILDSITTLSPEIDSIESRSNNNIMKNSTETPQQEYTETTTLGPDGPKGQGKFFNKLAQLLTRANAFGFQIKTCDDVEPFTMKDMHLSNDKLAPLVGYLFIYIVVLKFISYFIVEICVKLKL